VYEANVGTANDGIPDLIINYLTGQVTLDTNGLVLQGVQIQSRGLNGSILASGDGDGYLVAGRPPFKRVFGPGIEFNEFTTNNSSVDEYFAGLATLGGLPAGQYDMGILINPTALGAQGDPTAFLLADLRFGYNGDPSAAGNGSIILVPEPSTWLLGLLSLAGFAWFVRRRRTA
jgi:hypothetical protein